MLYLLDTNVISDYVRGHPQVDAHMKLCSMADLAVSSMTIMEIDQRHSYFAL
jgi:predicted nucleic acid-binding protein